jgi:hypothetical protein
LKGYTEIQDTAFPELSSVPVLAPADQAQMKKKLISSYHQKRRNLQTVRKKSLEQDLKRKDLEEQKP